jgi:hypothetical protein
MLYLPDEIIEAIQKKEFLIEREEGDPERLCHEVLDLDPNEPYALAVLAELRRVAGDRAEAETIAWHLADVMPCHYMPYVRLSNVYDKEDPMAKGLAELACRKMMLEAEIPDIGLTDFTWETESGKPENIEVLADWLRKARDQETPEVTARLQPHRLLLDVQTNDLLEPEQVDAVVAAGVSIVPLLVGVLRSWARGSLNEEDSGVVENSIALLGEIGEISVIPELLDLPSSDEMDVSGVSEWALTRLIEKHPEEAARVMCEVAPASLSSPRVAIAQQLIHRPDIDPQGTVFDSLFENFERIERERRDDAFQVLMSIGLVLHGRTIVERGRGLLRRIGPLLSRDCRRAVDELLTEYSTKPLGDPPPRMETSPWNVYQICNGEVDWETEMAEDDIGEDDAEYIPEPIQRQALPGRNDSCWCGSGKKYKKCHLDSDEERQRESR